MPSEIVAIGGACVDHLSIVSHTPDGWERCGPPLVQGGGPAATGATAIARLGGDVELWSVVGSDYHGEMIRNELRKDGVDVSQISVLEGYRSGCSFIEVDSETGERTIYGTGPQSRPAELDHYFEPARARGAKALLVTRFAVGAALAAAKHVRESGGVVVSDMHRVDGPVSELVHHVDALIMPQFSVVPLAGSYDIQKALKVLADLGSTMPTITIGPEGCHYLADGVPYYCPAFPVKTVDTTGCGDSFHGAYTYAMAKRFDQHSAIRFASAIAGLKATKLGGRSGLPTLAEVEEFLKERPDEARARSLHGKLA